MRYVWIAFWLFWPIATVVFCLWAAVVGVGDNVDNAFNPVRMLIVGLGAIVSYFILVAIMEIYWRNGK